MKAFLKQMALTKDLNKPDFYTLPPAAFGTRYQFLNKHREAQRIREKLQQEVFERLVSLLWKGSALFWLLWCPWCRGSKQSCETRAGRRVQPKMVTRVTHTWSGWDSPRLLSKKPRQNTQELLIPPGTASRSPQFWGDFYFVTFGLPRGMDIVIFDQDTKE